MKKKIFVGALSLVAVAGGVAGLSAFEAHVINVTAKIENALQVPTDPLNFGTVFPQEELDQTLRVALSSSFASSTDANDVEYIIRQKPKCGVTEDDGETLVGPTWTGHIVAASGTSEYTVDCDEDRPDGVGPGPTPDYYLLPSLCEYLSKHPDANPTPGNDDSLDSFHQPWTINTDGTIDWNDVEGRLAKSEQDLEDTWTIDLKVPCFGDNCAQDWADFVTGINPDADPDDYVLDEDLEHKIFGCNLWIEVTGVSRFSDED